ncbi:MAG: DUF5522 domain-containing protein [Acidimicrobiia bacterium]
MTARDPLRSLDQPHPTRLAPTTPGYSSIMDAHREALSNGEPGYIDPVSGYFVFTAAYLADRDCCDCGCRHCPYVSS